LFAVAFAHEVGKVVNHEGVIDQDLYSAGERVNVRARVNGDVVVAGGQVRIDNQVSGDVIAVGRRVDIAASVLDDVRAAGGEVIVQNRVDGDFVAAGGHILLEQSAVVGERAWLAGGEIDIDGRIGKELRAAGGEVVLTGQVNGDVTLYADSVHILPTARISGNLLYHSAHEADISGAAVINGKVTHVPVERDGGHHGNGGALLGVMALFTTGAALYLMYPHFALATLGALGERPGTSFGLGLVVLFVTPPVAILLMISVVGSILGLLVLLLYLPILLAGFLTGMLYFGSGLLRLVRQPLDDRRGRRVLSLAGAFILLWLSGFVPTVSTILILVATLFGTGALELQMIRMYRTYREVEGDA